MWRAAEFRAAATFRPFLGLMTSDRSGAMGETGLMVSERISHGRILSLTANAFSHTQQ